MKALILAIGLLFAGAALADGTATYRSGDMSVDYAWRGDAVRIEAGGGSYMLVLDGEIYMISQEEDRPRVIAMSDFMTRFGTPDTATALPDDAASFSMEPTGDSETVTGITGEVYTYTAVQADGSRSSGEMVLSDNSLAEEATGAMMAMVTAMSRESDAVTEEFMARDQGWLRFEDDKGHTMVLTAISDDTPPASLFELPAEPMQMPAMSGAGADTGTTEQDGGLFGGLFGGAGDKVEAKAERQRQRQSSHVEQRVDEETDNVVDKAVDGLMDSLFGG